MTLQDPEKKSCSKHPDGPKIRARPVGTLESVWCCLICGEHLCSAGPTQTNVRDTQTIDSVGDVESVLSAPEETSEIDPSARQADVSQDQDWSKHDTGPEHNCSCSCGTDYKTHAKFVLGEGLVARKPCPGCGSTKRLRAARSDDWDKF